MKTIIALLAVVALVGCKDDKKKDKPMPKPPKAEKPAEKPEPPKEEPKPEKPEAPKHDPSRKLSKVYHEPTWGDPKDPMCLKQAEKFEKMCDYKGHDGYAYKCEHAPGGTRFYCYK